MPLTREAVSASGQRATGLLPRISLIVGGCAVTLVTGLVTAGIAARSLFNYAIPFAIEYSEYLIPVIALWGAAYTLREGGHVNADIFFRRLSARQRLWFSLIGYLVGLAYLTVLGRQTFTLALNSIKLNYTSMYPLETPVGYPQLVMSLGIALFALQLIIEIIIKARRLFLSYQSNMMEDFRSSQQ